MAHNYGNSHPRPQPPAQRSAPAPPEDPPPRVVARPAPDLFDIPVPMPSDLQPDLEPRVSCCQATYSCLFSITGLEDDDGMLCGYNIFKTESACSFCEWEYGETCDELGSFQLTEITDEGGCYMTCKVLLLENTGECDCANTQDTPYEGPPPGSYGESPEYPPGGVTRCGKGSTESETKMFAECRPGGCDALGDSLFREIAMWISEQARYNLVECCTGKPIERDDGIIIPMGRRAGYAKNDPSKIKRAFNEGLATGSSTLRNIETDEVITNPDYIRLQTKLNNEISKNLGSSISAVGPAIKPEIYPGDHPGPGPTLPPMSGCCEGGAYLTFSASGNVDDDGCLHGWSIFMDAEANSYCEPRSIEFGCPESAGYSSSDVSIDTDNCTFYAKFYVHKEMGRCDCPTTVTFGTGYRSLERQTFSPCDPGGCGALSGYLTAMMLGLKGNVPEIVECCDPTIPNLGEGVVFRSGEDFTIDDEKYTVTTEGDHPLKVDSQDWYGIPIEKIVESFQEALENGGNSRIRSLDNHEIINDHRVQDIYDKNIQRFETRHKQSASNSETIVADARLDTIVDMLDDVSNKIDNNNTQPAESYVFRGEWKSLKPNSTQYRHLKHPS